MNLQPQIQPFISLFSTSSDFDQKSKDGHDGWRVTSGEKGKTEEDESQPLISLGLGIGGTHFCKTKGPDDRVKDNIFDRSLMVEEEEEDDDDQVDEREECRKYSVVRFTEEQLEELKRQLLIFKYMVWGLPVPFQLLLPIWRSLSSSSVSHHLDFNKGSSPFLLAFFRGGFDYGQVMDPEPGRCRRTDGKKWRCHQSVIPNEKYCEKHMHRGSKRSRKLVEASPKSGTPNLINFNRNSNLSSDVRLKFPGSLNQINGPSRVMMRAPDMTNSTAKRNDNNHDNNQRNSEAKRDIVANERTPVININLASGLDFSPKSVLQNDPSMRCPTVESRKRNSEPESRCRRTDGKKWRCKKEVVPDHKYCAQHINRGKVRLEKPSLASSTSREAQAAYGSTSSAKFSGTERAKVGFSLDTNLKISPPARPADPRNIIEDSMAGNGGRSSSSEATESDESTNFSDIIVLSP